MLRLFARARLTLAFLRSGGGIAALIAVPVSWLGYLGISLHRDGWSPFAAIELYEVVLILALGILYLSGNSPPSFVVNIIFILHYGFWFWEFGRALGFWSYSGPFAPTVGLCAGLTWIFYLQQVRRHPAFDSSGARSQHTDAKPFNATEYTNWELSTDRANSARRYMQASGLRADQVKEVRGFADQQLRKPEDPENASNRRISVIVKYLKGAPAAAKTEAAHAEKSAH